ncbi:MAG: hypothetical protein IIX48_06905 [Lachnospiraceae bacterium]|nr:hypothetical protein [Lachnospiraceae bacterium]
MKCRKIVVVFLSDDVGKQQIAAHFHAIMKSMMTPVSSDYCILNNNKFAKEEAFYAK